MIASGAIVLDRGQPLAAASQQVPPVCSRGHEPLRRHGLPPRQATHQPNRFAFRRELSSVLPAATFALKLVASALAGAALTFLLWNDDPKPAAPYTFDSDHLAPARSPSRRESIVYSRMRPAGYVSDTDSVQPDLDREVPSNFPLRVTTVKFTLPGYVTTSSSASNQLIGKPLRYLIGTEGTGVGRDEDVTVVSYNTTQPAKRGISIAYCNLFDEKNTGRYGPYLHTSDTAQQYNEGQIDPRGPGWERNLREQFERRKRQGFEYIELDNPDAYSIKDVIGAIELAASYGLKVIAKNPGLMEAGSAAATAYVGHPNVYGIIVEKGAGNPSGMDTLRRRAGKPSLPVWFVAFGSGRSWAGSVADAAKHYRNMGVTYSSAGEYGNAIDILPPA
jgi:hypothetical protein